MVDSSSDDEEEKLLYMKYEESAKEFNRHFESMQLGWYMNARDSTAFMEGANMKMVLFDDFNKHLNKVGFTFLKNYGFTGRCIPWKNVLAADQFHADYESYEVIVTEPKDKKKRAFRYKYHVIFHLMLTPFFAV